MTEGKSVMRRKDKEVLDPALTGEIIGRAMVLHLAIAAPARPYLVPLSFGYHGGAFFFHTASEGRKIDLLRENPRVCFEVEEGVELVRKGGACGWTFAYRSVQGFGTVRELTGDREKRKGLTTIALHYGGEASDVPEGISDELLVWRIDVEELHGRQSGSG